MTSPPEPSAALRPVPLRERAETARVRPSWRVGVFDIALVGPERS